MAQEVDFKWRMNPTVGPTPFSLMHVAAVPVSELPVQEELARDGRHKDLEDPSQEPEKENSNQNQDGQCCGKHGICSQEVLWKQTSGCDSGTGSNPSTGKCGSAHCQHSVDSAPAPVNLKFFQAVAEASCCESLSA
eukprot:Gb_04824 [translate_table: standard]